jgi:hypothetical protein
MKFSNERKQRLEHERLQVLKKLGFIGNYSQLKHIELKANREAVRYCNGEIDTDKWYTVENNLYAELQALFKNKKLPDGFFINADPRGYALKIKPQDKHIDGIPTDWGGYHCLCGDVS